MVKVYNEVVVILWIKCVVFCLFSLLISIKFYREINLVNYSHLSKKIRLKFIVFIAFFFFFSFSPLYILNPTLHYFKKYYNLDTYYKTIEWYYWDVFEAVYLIVHCALPCYSTPTPPGPVKFTDVFYYGHFLMFYLKLICM